MLEPEGFACFELDRGDEDEKLEDLTGIYTYSIVGGLSISHHYCLPF